MPRSQLTFIPPLQSGPKTKTWGMPTFRLGLPTSTKAVNTIALQIRSQVNVI